MVETGDDVGCGGTQRRLFGGWARNAADAADPRDLMLNTQGVVPALALDGQVLTRSPAIIENPEDTPPTPLLPAAAIDRAYIRRIAQPIGCDIHPIDNLRVLNSGRDPPRQDEAAVQSWFNRWISLGLDVLEWRLAHDMPTGGLLFGIHQGSPISA